MDYRQLLQARNREAEQSAQGLLPATTHVAICKRLRWDEFGIEAYVETTVHECLSEESARALDGVVAIFPREAKGN